MKISRLTTLLLIIPLLMSCAKNPATGNQDFVMMTEEEELQIGKQIFIEMRKNLVLLPKDDPLAIYVDRVGQKVAATADRKDLFFRFYVVDDDTINAFALPGGYICIHRGLVNHMNNEAELAAVLGHEVGHVTARHSVQQISKARAYQNAMMITSIFVPIPQVAGMLGNVMATAILKGYGRDAEMQSDELSIRYLTQAGYDPRATIGILKTLHRLGEIDTKEKTDAGEKVEPYHGAFASHPETSKRVDAAIAKASGIKGRGGLINREAMLAAIDGYAYGDSAEQGAVVGRRFLHPQLGVQLEFPKDWVITNSAQAVTARIRKQKVYFMFTMEDLQKRQSAEEIIRKMFTDRHILKVETGVQQGMPYAHAKIRESAPNVSLAMIDSHVFLDGRKAYKLTMWSERDKFDQYENQFARIAKSFGKYNKERDGDIPRIQVYKWKAGDSWQLLANRNNNILGRFTADKIAALNGMELSETPPAGKLIKTVK
ncbi:TPR repeat-containing protein YfgC precursor [Mariprofundus micogutta]|uniref:TPR repeat-containing protein YfgC n=1 Tax=Mariprofundus micogutta TaxID=1921010 RepID=A0A1L8CK13_9PROT|nr:M48 family metalloprotease [Mariprofundus micogutta]GAV19231.1 TPR repeat-containing protein YfgC precursor [Mariprofundus micogutta]